MSKWWDDDSDVPVDEYQRRVADWEADPRDLDKYQAMAHCYGRIDYAAQKAGDKAMKQSGKRKK